MADGVEKSRFMSTITLSTAQSQLLDHVMVWGHLRIHEITQDPLVSPTIRGRESTQGLSLPSVRVIRYLDRVKGHETSLLSALGIDTNDLEKELSRQGGAPSLSNYLWTRRPAWLTGDTSTIARVTMDDLSQIRIARLNTLERVMRWKRHFGATENVGSRINVVGFKNNLNWLQETYSLRHTFARDLTKRSKHGWDLVQAFYDSAGRAAQNMMDSAMALRHYHKIVPPV
jgi:hypothetical protein